MFFQQQQRKNLNDFNNKKCPTILYRIEFVGELSSFSIKENHTFSID